LRAFTLVLKVLAPVFLVVAALHLILGLGADALLGAQVPAAALGEPSLDSQNRFYGVAFAVYGAILYLSARDVPRYEPALKAALYVFFAGGLTRVLSWAIHGRPATLVIVLASTELLAPPLLLLWLAKVRATG